MPEPFDRLASFENLYSAAAQARKGKRFKTGAALFHHDLARNLVRLRDELMSQTYRPGAYRTFRICEPAERFISAAPYRDRVVHHALCNVTEPLFERSFIFDSYANRLGKGTHRALDRCTSYSRRFRYVLQCDIRKFFPSIDHQALFELLARRIGDEKVLWLIRLIIDSSNEQEPAHFYFPGDNLFTPFERRKGLPIGNLTSQFWANVYLEPIDHLVKDHLGVPGYVRYVDDFLLFSNSKDDLHDWRRMIERRLEELRLLLNGRKTRLFETREGIAFLGFRVFPTHRLLLPGAVKRARRRLRRLTQQFAEGRISMSDVRQSVQAWIAHAAHGDTKGLRRRLFGDAVFRARGHHSGRVVEQQQ